MDGVKPKQFGEAKVDGVEPNEHIEANNHVEIVASEGAPKKTRKPRHRKFIDLQKQPPKPKPLLQE